MDENNNSTALTDEKILKPVKPCYNKLFKLMIDKKMKKGELCKRIKISGTTLSKMGRGENVTVDILIRICRVLDCKLDDIVDIDPDDE